MKQWCLVMAITCSVFAASGQYYDIKCSPCKLDSLINAWEKEHAFNAIMDSSRLQKLAEPVYVELVHASFKDIVMDVFNKQSKLGGYFNTTGEFIIKEKAIPAGKDTDKRYCITTRGQLVDHKGRPISFATVTLNEKTILATDSLGNFTWDWCRGDSLHISHVNFQDKAIAWQDSSALTIRLQGKIQDRDPANIYGYVENDPIKKTATFSVVRPNYPSNNVMDVVRWVPGLQISMNSGVPGANYNLKLRGNNFINNSTGWQYRQGDEPLVTINGIPLPSLNIPLNHFLSMNGDPASAPGLSPLYTLGALDIEEIRVLKDAEATAIYGARGANGVITIRTKKAVHLGPEWNVYVASGLGQALGAMNDLMNTWQYRAMRYDAFAADGLTPTPETAPDLLVWDSSRYTNFKKWLLKGKAWYQDAQIGFSNGNESLRYLVSGSYHRETTVLPGDVWAQRGAVITDMSYAGPNNKLRLGITGYVTRTENNWTVDNPMYAMLSAPNLPTLFNNDGSYKWQQDSIFYLNPWSYFLKTLKIKTTSILMHAFANYQILPDLHAQLSIGYNRINTTEASIMPIKAQIPTGNPTGSFSQGNNRLRTIQIEPQLNYNFSMAAGILKWQAMIAGSWLDQINTTSATDLTGYTNDDSLGSPQAAAKTTKTGEKIIYRFQSCFARLNLAVKDQYFFSLTGRYDFSSRFGDNSRKAQFYSIGAGWIIYKEDSLVRARYLLSFAKLRGSWGITGNDRIGDYKYLNSYTVTTGSQLYQGMPVASSNNLANPYYEWETNRKLELALETSWFSKKVSLNLIYYMNRSSNLLLDNLLPAQTGFGVIRSNFPAVIRNSGLEVEAETRLGNRYFSWNSNLALALPANKLVRFPNLQQSSYRNSLIVGESVNTKKLYRYSGVDKTTGLFSVSDTTDKVTYNYDPKIFGSLLETFTLGRFQLTTGIEFRIQKATQSQAYLYNHVQPGMTNATWQSNQFAALADHWKPAGTAAGWQKPSTQGSPDVTNAINNWLNSDAQIADASFARWKFVNIKYFLPESFIRRCRLKSAHIFCNAENIATVTSYQGADPEVLNPLVLPPTKVLTFGFQLTF